MSNVIAENDQVAMRLEKNEITVRGKRNESDLFRDPVKIRIGSIAESPIKGTYVYESQRQDGGWEEIAYVKGAQDERHRADPFNLTGEMELFVRHHQPGISDDQQFVRVARFRWDGIKFYVPVSGLTNAGMAGRLYSSDGKVCLNLQSDLRGGLVCYDTNNGSLDETTWRPVWALRNGHVENFP